MAVTALAVFSSFTPQAEAHSWMDCVDWKRAKGLKENDWSKGTCNGFIRRYQVKSDGTPKFHFGKMDSETDGDGLSRHYLQDRSPNAAPCSHLCKRKNGKCVKEGKAELGSDESRGNPVASAYGGKRYGKMTVTSVGKMLCLRWPAKNHADPNPNLSSETTVILSMTKDSNKPDPKTQKAMSAFSFPGNKLRYRNCNSGKNQDIRPCGGCFKVPQRAPGTYLLQWRWELNKGEFYASCADIQIVK